MVGWIIGRKSRAARAALQKRSAPRVQNPPFGESFPAFHEGNGGWAAARCASHGGGVAARPATPAPSASSPTTALSDKRSSGSRPGQRATPLPRLSTTDDEVIRDEQPTTRDEHPQDRPAHGHPHH